MHGVRGEGTLPTGGGKQMVTDGQIQTTYLWGTWGGSRCGCQIRKEGR